MARTIVIEGIDCAGKSTLVKELQHALSRDAMFLGHADTNQFMRYAQIYSSSTGAIIERGHVSEMVYSKIFHRVRPFTQKQQNILDEILSETCILVKCIPNLETAIERYQERKHASQKIAYDEIEKGMMLFDDYFKTMRGEYCITYRSKNYQELKQVVKKIIQRSHEL